MFRLDLIVKPLAFRFGVVETLLPTSLFFELGRLTKELHGTVKCIYCQVAFRARKVLGEQSAESEATGHRFPYSFNRAFGRERVCSRLTAAVVAAGREQRTPTIERARQHNSILEHLT